MEMPDQINHKMIAVCGMNCKVCYKHLQLTKHTKPCNGCKFQDATIPSSCRNCKIVHCAHERGLNYCFQCKLFPCKYVNNLDKSYKKRYNISLIKNSMNILEKSIASFLCDEKEKWTCQDCNGIISLHDKVCSKCSKKQS